ncbi:hypothetical protein MKEN_01055700 [Mycena kentingensis (nom. inval.)]|nr:hypothetical protein MKEN_01055700 [Mycena kentingensis (nom. inval.)]
MSQSTISQTHPLRGSAEELRLLLRALHSKYSPGTVRAFTEDPDNADLIDRTAILLRPTGDGPAEPPSLRSDAGLTAHLRRVVDISPASVNRLVSNPSEALSDVLKQAGTLLGLANNVPAPSQASQNSRAASGGPSSSAPKPQAVKPDIPKNTQKMIDRFLVLCAIPPNTPQHYIAFYNAGFNLDDIRANRETESWGRAARGYVKLVDENDESVKSRLLWMRACDGIFGKEIQSPIMVGHLPEFETHHEEGQPDISYAMDLDEAVSEINKEATTNILATSVVMTVAAIAFAVDQKTRSEDDLDEIARLRFAAHPRYGKLVEDVRDDPEKLKERIKERESVAFATFKRNDHEKEMTARNRSLEAYKSLGILVFLDPSFSPLRLHPNKTTPSYPKFVETIKPEIDLSAHYRHSRGAVLGILNALDSCLAGLVRKFEKDFPYTSL